MTDLQVFLERTTALHNHLCPRQVIGVRMGMLAGKLLSLELPQADKRLYCFLETDGCFADGVSVATGCWLGHRTMRLMDYGKVAATFVDSKSGAAFRIWPHPKARARAAECRPYSESRWLAQLEAYQVMPDEELLQSEPVYLNFSLEALISKPGVRVNCAHCGEEILNEREVVIGTEILCRSCADGGYYQVIAPVPVAADHE